MAALRAVEVTGRGALEELRRILGLLRDDEAEQPSLAPAPGVGDLDELADTVQAAGIPVRLMVTGETAALPPAASLTVYRIVQEALTNVVKHARDAEASVRVRLGPDGVLVVVSDSGCGTAAAEAWGPAGHGIVGMRERAAVFGGTLDAGPLPGGGFQLHHEHVHRGRGRPVRHLARPVELGQAHLGIGPHRRRREPRRRGRQLRLRDGEQAEHRPEAGHRRD